MEKLIEEVRKYPCLYDTRTEEYKDLQRKDNCWSLIAQSLHRDCKSLKQDWKKLRDCFRQAQARRNTTNGQSTKNWKPWRYEKQMQFLIPFMSSREINANMESIDRDGMDYSEEIPATTVGDIQEGVPASPSTSKMEILAVIKRGGLLPHVILIKTSRVCVTNNLFPTCRMTCIFFMSACQSARQLPRRLQNQIKREVLDCIARVEEQYDDECKNNPSVSRISSSESSLPYGAHIAILKTEM